LFSERALADRFAASAWFEEFGLVKGASAKAFIEALGLCVEDGWIAKVLLDPNPPHEWAEGKVKGCVMDASELHACLREEYRDVLDD